MSQGQGVLWGQPPDETALALLAEVEAPEGDTDAPSRSAAEAWLVEMLRNDGEVRATYLQEAAARAGHAWATVRRAKNTLGIVSRNEGKDGWWWCWDKVLKPEQDAHLKNSEHVSTCSPHEHVSTCEPFKGAQDAHLNGVSTFPANVSTLSNGEVVQ